MNTLELKEKFLRFFVARNHHQIPSAPLIPENDPTALFISAGMQPLVPYLLGEPHPSGKRLCNCQKCLRTVDIDSVGDNYHHTFFEMLGNWSLGDYWKEEMIPWSYEFLTKELSIPSGRIYVTCFGGDRDAPRDEESANLWEKLGIPRSRIFFLGRKENWWGPVGRIGPCGPDTEMFYDTGKEKCSSNCRPGCSCGKYVEIWNDVFMEYEKKIKEENENEFEYVPLKQKNIDTGMGVERTTAILSGHFDDYKIDVFVPLIEEIQKIAKVAYGDPKVQRATRLIADHLRASVFVIADGIEPSNTEQGYILRRLIRRAIRFSNNLGIHENFCPIIGQKVIEIMGEFYPELIENQEKINQVLRDEESKFKKTLDRGLKEFSKIVANNPSRIDGKQVFFLYETYGFPLELTEELAKEKSLIIDRNGFFKALAEHQEKSRKGAENKFTGGLAEFSEITTKYHTATHLLHQALRDVLGNHVRQAGSNITKERLRFDFTHPDKLTSEQLNQVEEIVNRKIAENLPVKVQIMSLSEAQKSGALAFFAQKYGEKVKVYSIGDYSKEVCGGPHVTSTGEIGRIKIIKEESCGAGKRRIYAIIV